MKGRNSQPPTNLTLLFSRMFLLTLLSWLVIYNEQETVFPDFILLAEDLLPVWFQVSGQYGQMEIEGREIFQTQFFSIVFSR